ncbi:hypothetical protein D9M70_393300 [compost metagenome]
MHLLNLFCFCFKKSCANDATSTMAHWRLVPFGYSLGLAETPRQTLCATAQGTNYPSPVARSALTLSNTQLRHYSLQRYHDKLGTLEEERRVRLPCIKNHLKLATVIVHENLHSTTCHRFQTTFVKIQHTLHCWVIGLKLHVQRDEQESLQRWV